MAEAGTDSQVYIKVFGVKGSSSEIFIDKLSERFERGKTDLIKVSFYHLLYVCFLRSPQGFLYLGVSSGAAGTFCDRVAVYCLNVQICLLN